MASGLLIDCVALLLFLPLGEAPGTPPEIPPAKSKEIFTHELRIHDKVEHFREGRFHGSRVSTDPPGVTFDRCPWRDTAAQAKEAVAAEMWYESPVVESGSPFNETLLSWNIDVPPGQGFRVDIRVGRMSDGFWSPYLCLGDWGDQEPAPQKTLRFEGGFIDVDYFRSEACYDRAQYRVTALRAKGRTAEEARQPGDAKAADGKSKGAPSGEKPFRIALMAVTFSNTLGTTAGRKAEAAPSSAASKMPEPPPEAWQRRLPVPFRSQRLESPAIAGSICSPTSVAMVLEYRGVKRPTAEVAANIYDSVHEIYGNWPRAIQVAFGYGVPGYLTRFSDWGEVRRRIAEGQPLIISIKASTGELPGAPYSFTAGHLLVLVGFDAKGNVLVNDPAAPTDEKGQCAYGLREIERVWMGRGGTAYVLLPKL